MEGDEGAAEDERTIELSSIAAIYPELVIDPTDPYTATLDLSVSPAKPLRTVFQTALGARPPVLPTPPTSMKHSDEDVRAVRKATPEDSQQGTVPTDEHELTHLPPLIVHIHLPEGYPVHLPPGISLSADPAWVPPSILKHLQGSCGMLWEALGRDQVVYTYIDHLQQAAEDAFGLVQAGEQTHPLSSDLKLALLDYDLKTKREIFERGTFNCGVCLEPKKGGQCHRLMLCSHVFCIACLQEFYHDCIKGGDVDSVKCMDPGCHTEEQAPPAQSDNTSRKQRRYDPTLTPSELLQIPLDQETVQRYVRLKRKKRLESDKNTIYCPRQWCQGAARSKKHPKPVDPFNDMGAVSSDSENEDQVENTKHPNKDDPDHIPMSERLAICEDCDYAFCLVCKKTWHGERGTCKTRRQAELNEEEQASLAYLQSFTTPCPTCSASAQKTMGCNHMICFQCKTHFCYLCSAFLMPNNPYRHFNDIKSQCYMRLWELEGGDGNDVGNGYRGGVAIVPGEVDSDDGSDTSSLLDDDGDALEELLADVASDDDEPELGPQPLARNPNQIEIINFARQGGVEHRRIIHNIPERPRNPVPFPAPVVPPRRRRLPLANRHQRRERQMDLQRPPQQQPARGIEPGLPPPRVPHPAVLAQAMPVNPILPLAAEVLNRQLGPQVIAAPGQGNNVHAGLDRFLALAERDEEDEWDSDELPDADGFGDDDDGDER